MMATSRDARLRQGLNPLLTTALSPYTPSGPSSQSIGTPLSAVSMTSSHFPSSQASTPLQPYNPGEWVSTPATMPERHFSPMGAEPVSSTSAAAALPPPPYSPPRSQRPISTAFEQITQSSPIPPVPRLPSHRPSPEPMNVNFPPPPGLVGRGSSRERRFGLPSLTRRREQESTAGPSTQPAIRPSIAPLPLRLQTEPAVIHAHEPYRPDAMSADSLPGPPAARRAVSASAIDTPTSARSRSGSQTRWEPGMPMPPPPPGPPPSHSRSQSVQPVDQNKVPIISPPTRRPPPSSGSALGPVPPTPAGWIDSDTPAEQPESSARGRARGLTIDTVVAEDDPVKDPMPSASSTGSLNRSKAVRHDKTIMQRRAESRTRHQPSIDATAMSKQPADMSITTDAEAMASRLLYNKLTPNTGDSCNSRNSTPRASSSKQPMHEASTPPFSPYSTRLAQRSAPLMGSIPKSLPTPPQGQHSRSASRGPRDQSRGPSRPPSSAGSISRHTAISQTGEQFAAAAIERFQAFASQEALAVDDAERVRLFAAFFVNESMIRRERYNSAIGAMGSEIFDLTRDMFQPLRSERRPSAASENEWTPATTTDASADPSHHGSTSSQYGDGAGPSSSAPTSAGVPVSPSTQQANTGTWAAGYKPSLSPILSMSVSDNYENGSSRGRPPSRWWESNSQGDPQRAGFERSARESKYMGVRKDQWDESFNETEESASDDIYASSEYPPEKTGWHHGGDVPSSPPMTRGSISPEPNAKALDVSRLVTMPPPYPRHHPAVNNSHPELVTIRTTVRALTDVSELEASKTAFNHELTKRRNSFDKHSAERISALRANLQSETASGNLAYADAAAIEADSQAAENTQKRDMEKKEYERFQKLVIDPLNNILSERIARATELFDGLSEKLFDHGQNDADMPQEEGDDRPELLEKLTLLKWIFEARESLHKATFDLLSDRNSRYRDVVLLPYQLSNNTDKLREAQVFFAKDVATRNYAFAHEVLGRTRDFRAVMEEAVGHGVAMQLSAFWDIAPPLSSLLDGIPLDLREFSIQIPTSEYDENPSYHDHPLQYLYSLLLHAEKSSFQFIESHENLLCLLHEVKEAVVNAKIRVLETEVLEGGEEGKQEREEDRVMRVAEMRRVEGGRLTEDLKEKVRVVRDQWRSGLGEGVEGVKERVGEWLLERGGWDEALEDGGVGGV